jgi:hypothetical protein
MGHGIKSVPMSFWKLKLFLRAEVEWQVQGADAYCGRNQQDYTKNVRDNCPGTQQNAAKAQEQQDNSCYGPDNAVNI